MLYFYWIKISRKTRLRRHSLRNHHHTQMTLQTFISSTQEKNWVETAKLNHLISTGHIHETIWSKRKKTTKNIKIKTRKLNVLLQRVKTWQTEIISRGTSTVTWRTRVSNRTKRHRRRRAEQSCDWMNTRRLVYSDWSSGCRVHSGISALAQGQISYKVQRNRM